MDHIFNKIYLNQLVKYSIAGKTPWNAYLYMRRHTTCTFEYRTLMLWYRNLDSLGPIHFIHIASGLVIKYNIPSEYKAPMQLTEITLLLRGQIYFLKILDQEIYPTKYLVSSLWVDWYISLKSRQVSECVALQTLSRVWEWNRPLTHQTGVIVTTIVFVYAITIVFVHVTTIALINVAGIVFFTCDYYCIFTCDNYCICTCDSYCISTCDTYCIRTCEHYCACTCDNYCINTCDNYCIFTCGNYCVCARDNYCIFTFHLYLICTCDNYYIFLNWTTIVSVCVKNNVFVKCENYCNNIVIQ